MARFGMFCFRGRGHLDPIAALGRRLVANGHQVTVFHLLVAQAAVRAAGLEFKPIDQYESRTVPRPPSRKSPVSFSFAATVNTVKAHAEQVLREGRQAAAAAQVDMIIADQMDVAAGTVAEAMGIPFVNVSCGPPIYLEDTVPPPYLFWKHRPGPWARARNRLGNSLMSVALRSVIDVVNVRRREWRLAELRHLNEAFSARAIITQLPLALELERPMPPRQLFYTAQFRDSHARKAIDFPWHRLDGRPLFYASMGTIRNDLPWVFQTIAHACAAFDVQLVLSLGAGPVRPAELGSLPANPIVVEYAPQLDLIRQSDLVINCAGLNTTLDSVSCGVPMVAIPVAEDQPGIAVRIQAKRMGVVVPLKRLSVARLQGAIRRVLDDPVYRTSARRLQATLKQIDGVERAAAIIERVLAGRASTYQPA